MRAICFLQDKPIYVGTKLIRYGTVVTAKSIFLDRDNDVFLEFEEGGNAYITGPSEMINDLNFFEEKA